MYSFKNSKLNIDKILRSLRPIEECKEFPSEDKPIFRNGVFLKVSSLVINIKDFDKIFTNKTLEEAKCLRALTSEIVSILKDSWAKVSELGVRKDMIYAIYSTPYIEDSYEVFNIAVKVNTFMKMFNEMIKEHGFNDVRIGIGIGYDEKELVIRAWKSANGINDKIYIGKANEDAKTLSELANNEVRYSILMNCNFRNRIYNTCIEKNPGSKILDHMNDGSFVFKEPYYYCNVVDSKIDNWIKHGMKI